MVVFGSIPASTDHRSTPNTTIQSRASPKRFSCTCGGGDDLTSKSACAMQPLTSWEWVMYGAGYKGDTIRMEVSGWWEWAPSNARF